MTDPKRLLDGDGSDLEQLLLASGRSARPKATARWKAEALFLLAGVGIVGKAKAAAVPGSKAYAWIATRYLAYALGAGATAWGAAHVLAARSPDAPSAGEQARAARPPASPRPVESPRAEAAPPNAPLAVPSPERNAVRAPSEGPSERAVARASREGARAVAASGPSQTPASSSSIAVADPVASSSVGSEIQELERARAALSTGDARGAIGALDRYDRAFPKGALQQEALRLRVEALVSVGDRTTARSLANRFRALYPNSPHAKRLNSLVNEP